MPPNFASKADPVDVQVQFYFASFDGVDEQHESVSVTGYLRTWWMDPRLAFATNSTDSCVEALTVPGDMPWIPKLHIYNSIKLLACTVACAEGEVGVPIDGLGNLLLGTVKNAKDTPKGW